MLALLSVIIYGGWIMAGWVLSGLASCVGVSSSASSSAASSSSASSSSSCSSVFSAVGTAVGTGMGGIVAVILILLMQAILDATLIPWPVLVVSVLVLLAMVALCLIVMWKVTTPDHQSGHPFVQMVCNTEYGRRYLCLWFRKPLDTPGRYDVYLITNGGNTNLHWTLLVRMRGLRIYLPYLSIEINTDVGMKEMIPIMRQFKDSEPPTTAKSMGSVTDKSIKQLCNLADTVRSEMGSYDITSSNCQDFCNKVLERMNLPTHTTTVQELRETASTAAATGAVTAATATVVVTIATAGASPFILPFMGIAVACAVLYNRLRCMTRTL